LMTEFGMDDLDIVGIILAVRRTIRVE